MIDVCTYQGVFRYHGGLLSPEPLQRPQTNILRLTTRHFWFGASFCFTSPEHEFAHICFIYKHSNTDTHTQRQEPRQRSHAHTSIFYHNFDAARLINLFAENIFTSFIRKNRRPTHHSSTHSFHAIGEMHFHQLLTISVFFFVVFFVFSRPTPEAICI